MRIFVTGATGFVGSAVVEELIGAGHQVLGLARNDAAADALKLIGAEAHNGDLSTPESLSAGAQKCDGVIHTAYNHDWSQVAAAAEMDRCAVETLGAALAGSDRPLVISSAIGLLSPGRPTSEADAGDPILLEQFVCHRRKRLLRWRRITSDQVSSGFLLLFMTERSRASSPE
jgi:uncharacterized protein YbjT (DUF2867 family)